MKTFLFHEGSPAKESLRTPALANHVQSLTDIGQNALPSFSARELQDRQRGDADLARVIFYVGRRRRPSRRERAQETWSTLRLLKQWQKLSLMDEILYRVAKDPATGKKKFQYVVPQSLGSDVLRGCHEDAGHQGQLRTLHLVKQRFYWASMERDVGDHVKCCTRCVVSKTLEPEGRAPLESVKTTAPLQLVCIDFWTAEDAKNRPVDVLVVTDHYTKLSHAFRCSDQTAKQVARKLWDNFFCFYGFPECIHSDQGANFESELIAALLQISGVKKSHTTAYHPMGNGLAERFNRTLGNMIRALPPREKQSWPQMLHTLAFMYNCTVHETTGFPPFYLMFGRVPRLPVDVLFKSVLREDGKVAYPKFVDSLHKDLREALLLVEKNTGREQKHQAQVYNRRVKGGQIVCGDRVLLVNKGERGRKKLADRWENVVYTVTDTDSKTHIYKILNPVTGQTKVVHRNMLLCVNFLPIMAEAVSESVSLDSSYSVECDDDTNFSSNQHTECVDKLARTNEWVSQISVEEPGLERPDNVLH